MIDDNDLKLVSGEEVTPFIDELKKIEWVYWLNRPYVVFTASILWEGEREKYYSRRAFKGLGADNHLYQFPDIYYDQKFHEKGLNFFNEYFKEHRVSDLTYMLKETHEFCVLELKKATQDIVMTMPEKTAVVSDLARYYLFYLNIVNQLEDYFNNRIKEEVPKYIQGDYSKFVGDISVPIKKNVYVLMIDEIKAGISNKEIVEKYGWMKSRDGFSDFYTEGEIEDIKRGIKETTKHEVDIPDGLLELAEELRELNFFRTDRTDKFYEYLGLTRPILEDIAKYVGVSFKELADYDANSIILDNPKKYARNFSYTLINNKYYIANGKVIDFAEHDKVEVKGRTAYKGVVQGIARIVIHSDDINKVKDGDILVSQMTFPSFISAMQKAAAFVTDEGSITCHAAIIAREMRKPCIVGTKNGTKVLKDGDMVEVDADSGVVKVLGNN